MPEAGLISGAIPPPAKAKLDKHTKSTSIAVDFKTDLLDGRFPGGSNVDASTSRSSMACGEPTDNVFPKKLSYQFE